MLLLEPVGLPTAKKVVHDKKFHNWEHERSFHHGNDSRLAMKNPDYTSPEEKMYRSHIIPAGKTEDPENYGRMKTKVSPAEMQEDGWLSAFQDLFGCVLSCKG